MLVVNGRDHDAALIEGAVIQGIIYLYRKSLAQMQENEIRESRFFQSNFVVFPPLEFDPGYPAAKKQSRYRPSLFFCKMQSDSALVVRVDDVLACSYGPFDNLHPSEPTTGPEAFVAPLKPVEISICSVSERLAAKMWEVIPLLERLDFVGVQGCSLRRHVPWIFVDL